MNIKVFLKHVRNFTLLFSLACHLQATSATKVPLLANTALQTYGQASGAYKEGALLFNKLGNINIHAMENPKTFDKVSRESIKNVKQAFQDTFIDYDALPEVLIQGLRLRARRKVSLYRILKYMYGSANIFLKKRRYPTYGEAYQAGIKVGHLKDFNRSIVDSISIGALYVESDDFRIAFSLLTNWVYREDIGLDITPLDESKKLSESHLKKLSPIQCWLKCQCATLTKNLRCFILQYAFGEGFDETYDDICSMSDLLFQKSITKGQRTFNGKQIPSSYIRKSKGILKMWFLEIDSLSSSFSLQCSSKTRQPLRYINGNDIVINICPLYDVVTYIKDTPYLQLLQEGWEMKHLSPIKESLNTCIVGARDQYYVKMRGGMKGYNAFLCLMGVYGAYKEVPEESAYRVLFEKLGRINIDAMKSNKMYASLSKKEVKRAREVFECMNIAYDSLPYFVIEAFNISVSGKCSLYKILDYIYWSGQLSLAKKGSPPTYREAYQAGISIEHLRVFREKIQSVVGHKFYSESAAFQKAFSLLTNGAFNDDISWEMTPLDESKKLSESHLKKLSPIQCWLKCQCATLTKELRCFILQYAFGEGPHQACDDVCSMSDLLFQKSIAKGQRTFKGKEIPINHIRKARKMIEISFIDMNLLPYSFSLQSRSQREERVSTVNGDDIVIKMCSLYEVMTYIKDTPYLELLQEGWEEEHSLRITNTLKVSIVYNVIHKYGNNGMQGYAHFLFLIGAYGVSILNNRPDLQRFIA